MLAVGLGAFLIMVTIPFILFAIIGIFKDKNKKAVLITLVCGVFLFSIGMKLDDDRQAKETVANNIMVAHNKVIADKKAKGLAEDKVISDRKAIADKKIADSKAIEDKKIADAQAKKDAETARLQAIEDKKVADEQQAKADADVEAQQEADAKAQADAVAQATAGKMTMDKFNQIKSGMSYEVTQIMGGDGETLSESGSPGEELYTVMYQYDGVGDVGANSNMMFQNDKLVNKAQMGCR